MLCFMQHLEVHVIESETDIDLALQAGVLTVDQLGHTQCLECATGVAYSGEDGFAAFAIVINEHNQDWSVCMQCAGPMVDQEPYIEESYEALVDRDLEDPENFDEIDYF